MPDTSTPLEVVVGIADVYLADVGTAVPDISVGATGFTLIGTAGKKNYDEAGVVIRSRQQIETDAFRMLGTLGPRKAARISEDLEVEFTLYDLNPEELLQAMTLSLTAGDITSVSASTGVAGGKKISMLRGLKVNQKALLVKWDAGSSPLAASMGMQLWLPRVVQVGQPELVSVKGRPIGLQFMLRAIEDASDGFGSLFLQSAAAT